MSDSSIWIALGACLAGTYFSACSTALKVFSRPKLSELLSVRGDGQRFDRFLTRVDDLQLVTAALRTTANLGVLFATLLYFEDRFGQVDAHWMTGVWAFITAGLLVVVFGVAIAGSLARHHPERLLARSLGLLNICLWLLRPVTYVLSPFDPIVRRLAGEPQQADGEDELTDEVMSVVEEHDEGKHVDDVQKDMLEAVFELRSTTAGEIMTPRTDVVGIPVAADLQKVKATILEEGFSRYPVYGRNLDDIVGVLYAKDMLRFLGDTGDQAFDIHSVLREALLVPESKSVRDLLAEFKTRQVHIAIVLDEYGGTAGLVTVEDVVEEIVGEIQDEYEDVVSQPEIRRIGPTTVDIDARVHVDDLNDELNLNLPEHDDYETVGGFVFATLGHVPDVGEAIDFAGGRLIVTEAQRTRVGRVRLELTDAARQHSRNDSA